MQVIVSQRGAEELREKIESLALQTHILVVDRDGRGAELSQAEALLAWGLSAEGLQYILRSAPRLRWIHTVSAGVDHLLTPELLRRDLVLTNSSGAHATPISEWVLAAILAAAKRFRELNAAQQERRWAKELALSELAGQLLLILGLGDIGQAVARRAAGFELRVWGTKRRQEPVPGVERLLRPEEWRAALPQANFVVVSTPLTQETRAMVGAAELAAMRPDAWLINIARGEIVDENALVAALQAGRLGGAALDVFQQEPLPQESPLWDLPNVIIAPHLSWSSPHIYQRASAVFLDNLRRYCYGQELVNVVDFEAGY